MNKLIYKILTSVTLLFLGEGLGRELPAWSVNPSDFQNSANLTAQLYIDHAASTNPADLLAAFVGDECRGVVSPVVMGENQLFFLTLYSNLNSEHLVLKAYISNLDTIIALNETIEFNSGSQYGEPLNPVELNAIVFFDHTPEVTGISDQSIEIGGEFTSFDLDDHLLELDGDEVSWGVSESQHLNVIINVENLVTITVVNNDWVGTDTLHFIVTDQTDSSLTSQDTVRYTVLALDHPPELTSIPDQTIGSGGSFTSISLENYLDEQDGDEVSWSYVFEDRIAADPLPEWSLETTEFSRTMNITASVQNRGRAISSDNSTLAIFAEDECRGLISPQIVDDEAIFFLTVYANTEGESLHFRLYDDEQQDNIPILESQVFESGISLGSPSDPVQLQAGFMIAEITSDHEVELSAVDPLWSGTEQIRFTVRDMGTLHNYQDSVSASFSILPDHTPLVSGIADQLIELGEDFISFDLDDYLTEVDGDAISWSVSGNTALHAIIDEDNRIDISALSEDWTGTETLLFTVTDNSANSFTSSDSALFSIIPIDHSPSIANMPDQTIGNGGAFDTIELDDYLTEIDGNEVQWGYTFATSLQTDSEPTWTVNAAGYSSDMTLTAGLIARGQPVHHGDFLLAAFYGEECRGVASPVAIGDDWIFFMTIYANQNGESLAFRLFDTQQAINMPVLEGLEFEASSSIGSPDTPHLMNAGFLQIEIDSNDEASILVMDSDWLGAEDIFFHARDIATENQFADSTVVRLTILPDHTPLVSGIPDQVGQYGDDFQSFDLDDYLTELDGDAVVWSVSGQLYHTVSIDVNNVVSFTTLEEDWSGSEHLIFEVSDISPNSFLSRDTATFIINPPDFPPNITMVPDDTIGIGGSFQIINLMTYLENLDGDSVSWSFDYVQAEDPISNPGWTINPGDFEHTMSMTASLSLRGEGSTNGQNSLAVFSNDECRGVAQAVLVGDASLYFLTIHGRSEGEALELRVYDQSRMDTLGIHQQFQFQSNAILGSPEAPQELFAQNISIEFLTDQVIQANHVNPLWAGTEIISLVVRDENTTLAYSDSTHIRFTVLPGQSPAILEIPDQIVEEGETFPPIVLDFYLENLEADEVIWNLSEPVDLVFTTDPNALLYAVTPDSNWFGSESLVLEAQSSANPTLTDQQTIQFTVLPVNDSPIAVNQTHELDEDSSIAISLTASDEENDNLTFTITHQPQHGGLNEGLYTPETNYFGLDSLGYVAFDGELFSNTALIYFNILPQNDPPQFESEPALGIEEDQEYVYVMLASDIDGDSLVFDVITIPDWLGFYTGFELRGIPTNEEVGHHPIQISVSDGASPDSIVYQTFSITVGDVNDPPVFFGATQDTARQDLRFNYDMQATDVDLDSLIFTVSGLPDWLSFIQPKTLSGIPTNADIGEYLFQLFVSDLQLASDTLELSLVVENVNDPPEAMAGEDQIFLSGSIIHLDGSSSHDMDGDQLTYLWSGDADISLNDADSSVVTIHLPQVEESTSYQFNLRVFDGSLYSELDSVRVEVTPLAEITSTDFEATPQVIGENISLEIGFPVYYFPVSATLYYLMGGSSEVDSVAMEKVTRSQVWVAAIPAEFVSEMGISYYAKAVDNQGNRVTLEPRSIAVEITTGAFGMSTTPTSAYPEGIPTDKWRLISFPSVQDQASVSELFTQPLGESAGEASWRLYGWNGEAWEAPDSIQPGKGYWFNQRLQTSLDLEVGSGRSANLTGVELNIEPGWNLYSSPYNFEISVEMDALAFDGPFTYGDFDGEGWTSQVNTLRPWESYALYSWADTSTNITLSPGLAPTDLPKSTIPDEGWVLNIAASNSSSSDIDNRIGRLQGARTKRDAFDRIEPPTWENHLSARIHNIDMDGTPTHFSSDIRPLDENLEVWMLQLTSTHGIRDVQMSLELQGQLPADQIIVLLDIQERSLVQVTGYTQFEVQDLRAGFSYNLTLFSGKPEAVYQEAGDALKMIPESNSLGSNFPNPFNASTQIRFNLRTLSVIKLDIFDIRGRQVATVFQGDHPLGYHSIMWNGLDEELSVLSSGVYIYRLSVIPRDGSQAYQASRKMVIVR